MLVTADTMLRGAMLGTLILPCVALVVWSYYADGASDPVPSVPCKERPEAHPMGEPLSFSTDEYEMDTVFDIPAEHEAVRQIKEVMAGKVTLCAVCYGYSDALYRVQMTDDSAFCCSICTEIIRAGALS